MLEGPDFGPVGADFLGSGHQVVDEARELGCAGVGAVLHFLAVIVHAVDGQHVHPQHQDARVQQGTAVGEELDEHDHSERQGEDGGEHVLGELGEQPHHGEHPVGKVSRGEALEESGGQGQQARHQRGLQRILRLVLHAHHQEVAGKLHHHQSGRRAEQQHRDGQQLG